MTPLIWIWLVFYIIGAALFGIGLAKSLNRPGGMHPTFYIGAGLWGTLHVGSVLFLVDYN